tara:strand:- start:213 stop:320 length:108 start_codon:yes stop_codon:yes gene_type:complete
MKLLICHFWLFFAEKFAFFADYSLPFLFHFFFLFF